MSESDSVFLSFVHMMLLTQLCKATESKPEKYEENMSFVVLKRGLENAKHYRVHYSSDFTTVHQNSSVISECYGEVVGIATLTVDFHACLTSSAFPV